MNTKNAKSKKRKNLRQAVRVIWAIVAKDLLEALKNKNTIAIILTTLPMIFVYYYLPILEASGEPPWARVYDAGESILVPLMENSDSVALRTYPSEEQMLAALRHNDVPEIGLVIPAGFDLALENGGETQLQGFILSWVDGQDALELQRAFEDEISNLLGRPVSIVMSDKPVNLEPDSHGVGVTASIAIVFVVVMIGLTMIPHLMLEEKSTRTMDVLRVSPASAGSLVAGKALVGLFYCLLGASIALAVFHWLVVHWWLAILAVVLGALFTVSLALWLGTIIESRAQLTMWAWVFILPLLLPVFLSLMSGLLPDALIQALQFLPTSILLNLLLTSYAAFIPLGSTLLLLAGLTAWAAAGLLFVTWLVRREERKESRPSAARQVTTDGSQEVGFRRYMPLLNSLFPARKADQVQPGSTAVSIDIPLKSNGEVEVKRSGLRIIWTIASKDIFATLRNKLALSIMLGTLFIVASSTLPRMLISGRGDPAVIVYDPGRSTILRALAADEDVRLGITDSLEEMQEIVSGSPDLRLGLVVPQDFDSLAGSRELIELDGYAVHWADAEKIQQWAVYFEEQIGGATWGTVKINLSDQGLYPPADLQGQNTMFVLLVTIVILTIGFALVPLLLVEERLAHTMEVLLVSPARIYEVVSGKALAGGFYCLLAVVVVFFLNRILVVNWGVAVLAVLLGGAFAVAVGLLVGILSDNPTSVGLWGSMLLLGLFGLTMVNAFLDIELPSVLQLLLQYLPTVALAELLSFSLAGEFPIMQMWANFAALLIATLVVFGILAWRLRFVDR